LRHHTQHRSEVINMAAKKKAKKAGKKKK